MFVVIVVWVLCCAVLVSLIVFFLFFFSLFVVSAFCSFGVDSLWVVFFGVLVYGCCQFALFVCLCVGAFACWFFVFFECCFVCVVLLLIVFCG